MSFVCESNERMFRRIPAHVPLSRREQRCPFRWTALSVVRKSYYRLCIASGQPVSRVSSLASIVSPCVCLISRYHLPRALRSIDRCYPLCPWIPAGGMSARLLFLHHSGEESAHPSKYFSYTMRHYNKSFFFCQHRNFQKVMNKQLRIIFTFNSFFSDFERNVSEWELEICLIWMPRLRGLMLNFLDIKR